MTNLRWDTVDFENIKHIIKLAMYIATNSYLYTHAQ